MADKEKTTCEEHGQVASMRGRLNTLIGLLSVLLMLIGYDIHTTQQIEVRVTEQVAKLGGEIMAAGLRQEGLYREVERNGAAIDDHEQRLRALENRE